MLEKREGEYLQLQSARYLLVSSREKNVIKGSINQETKKRGKNTLYFKNKEKERGRRRNYFLM